MPRGHEYEEKLRALFFAHGDPSATGLIVSPNIIFVRSTK